MRFRLRTLLILLAVLPPVLAGAWLKWRERLLLWERIRLEGCVEVDNATIAKLRRDQARR